MEDRSFYVYAHYRLDTMEPFYIGKGKGNRKDDINRNPMHDRISKKHGHAVVVLFDNLTEDEAFFYEREVIEDLVFNEGYEIKCKNCGEFTGKFSYLTNFSFGGEGLAGYNCSEETKKKISIASKKAMKNPKTIEKISKASKNYWEDKEAREKQSETAKKHWEYQDNRIKQSIAQNKRFENEEEREKISKAQKNRFENEEERKKVSETMKKHWEDEEYREKMSKAIKKIFENQEVRKKISKGVKKRFEDPEVRKKCGQPGEKHNSIKKVYCEELNIVFSYVKLAKQYCKDILNCDANNLNAVCRGYRKSAGKLADGTKLTWKWKIDVDKETLKNAIYINEAKYNELLSKNVNNCNK